MTTQEIQNAQQIGSNYANDNKVFFFIKGMNEDEFASAALENYNANSEAFGEDTLPKELETAFLFGAKKSYPVIG